jgi:hypothetical protein
MTYPDVKPVEQKLHPINPRKEAMIKDEVEKLLKVGFIYPVQLTEWVSNLVLINKKQGHDSRLYGFPRFEQSFPKRQFSNLVY